MKYYRVESRYPKLTTRWAYVSEHDHLTLSKARKIVKQREEYKDNGLRQRIVCVSTKVIK